MMISGEMFAQAMARNALVLTVLILKFGLCQKLRKDGDVSICEFLDDPSGLKKHIITTYDGFECDLIGVDDDCVEKLRGRGVVTGDCGRLLNAVSKCSINRSLTKKVCCRHEQRQDCSNAPIVIKFQQNEYEVTEGSDARVCLVITNSTVLSSTGITIDVCLNSTRNVSECFPVHLHFPEGSTVGNYQCTTFSTTSLNASQYILIAELLTLPKNSPSVNTTDSATLIILKSFNWAAVAVPVAAVIFIFVIVVSVAGARACARACARARARARAGGVAAGEGAGAGAVADGEGAGAGAGAGDGDGDGGVAAGEDAVNPPERVGINVLDAQNEGEVPLGEAETIPYSRSVQERGDRPPGSATLRGSQSGDDQSDLQCKDLPSFTIQMGENADTPPDMSHGSTQLSNSSSTSDFATVDSQTMRNKGKPEENGNSNANPHGHVLHVLDTPHHSHGTQPEDGSSTSGLAYPQPMNNKPLVGCGTGVVVYGASQASSLGSSDEAMQLTA